MPLISIYTHWPRKSRKPITCCTAHGEEFVQYLSLLIPLMKTIFVWRKTICLARSLRPCEYVSHYCAGMVLSCYSDPMIIHIQMLQILQIVTVGVSSNTLSVRTMY